MTCAKRGIRKDGITSCLPCCWQAKEDDGDGCIYSASKDSSDNVPSARLSAKEGERVVATDRLS